MKWSRWLIAIVMLLLPLAARALWFYQGVYTRAEPISTPDYVSFQIPQPTLSTPPALIKNDLSGAVIVVDMAHNNPVFLSELESLTHPIEVQGGRIEVYDMYGMPLSERLKYATALIIPAPVMAYNQDEMRAMSAFVKRGGHVLVLTDPTRDLPFGTSSDMGPIGGTGVDATNLILAPYDIFVSQDYLYNLVENEGNFRNVIFEQFAKSPLTDGLGKVVFYSAHSLKTKQTELIQGNASVFSSLTDAGGNLAVMATDSQGRVAVLGDMTFLTQPYNQVADNQVLIQNLVSFLFGEKRSRTLANFPHLFDRPVTILVPEKDPINSDFLAALASAQNGFKTLDIETNLSSKPDKEHDLLVLGLLPANDALKEMLKEYKLEFSKEPAATPTPYAFNMPGVMPSPAIPADSLTPTPTPSVGGDSLTPTPTPSVGADSLTPTPTPSVGADGLTPTPTPTPYFGDQFGGYNPYYQSDLISYVTVPGFGKFATQGLGLVIYSTTPERNTLYLLAGSESDLNILSIAISNGSLINCVVQGNIGVCKVSFANG